MMLEQTQNIEAKAAELRKTIQSQWILFVAIGLFYTATIVVFIVPKFRSLEVVFALLLIDSLYAWRTIVNIQTAQELKRELAQMQQEAIADSKAWPPPPHRPAS